MSSTMRMNNMPGKRATVQRKLLLDLIQQADGHLDADELTVYRNLKLFKDQGLVEERHFAEGHHHYEPKAVGEHHHLVCSICGEITEFVSPLTKQMKRQVELKNSFVITDVEIRMKGYCSRCRKNKE